MEDIHKLIGNVLNSSMETQPHFTAGNCCLDLDENKTYLRETTLLQEASSGNQGEEGSKRVYRNLRVKGFSERLALRPLTSKMQT